MSLVILSTHPIQYHAPVYRCVQSEYEIPVTVIYGSDFSIAGYRDREFGVDFSWDSDLLSGYTSIFLSHSQRGGADCAERVSARGIGNVLGHLQPEAILLTGYRPRFDLGAFLSARRRACPLLLRAETTDHAVTRGRLKRWARDVFLSRLYRNYSRLLYIGKRSRDHYVRLGAREDQLIFSPYCVDTSVFQVEDEDRLRLRHETRQALNLGDDQCVLLFSGKLVPRKGPELLLEAVKELRQTWRKHVAVLFLGEGDLRESLQEFAESTPVIAARFVGFQNQRSLSRFYHAADMLVMPSHVSETWGLVVNEALHHGLPCVVSSAVGAAPDLVEEGVTGATFQVGSVEELGCAIEQTMDLLEMPDLRLRCREKVNQYSLDAAARGIARAYREVVATRRGTEIAGGVFSR